MGHVFHVLAEWLLPPTLPSPPYVSAGPLPLSVFLLLLPFSPFAPCYLFLPLLSSLHFPVSFPVSCLHPFSFCLSSLLLLRVPAPAGCRTGCLPPCVGDRPKFSLFMWGQKIFSNNSRPTKGGGRGRAVLEEQRRPGSKKGFREEDGQLLKECVCEWV